MSPEKEFLIIVQSEVSQFRQEQQLQEQAAHQGLNGYITVASHIADIILLGERQMHS
jgi:hypothetical protein